MSAERGRWRLRLLSGVLIEAAPHLDSGVRRQGLLQQFCGFPASTLSGVILGFLENITTRKKHASFLPHLQKRESLCFLVRHHHKSREMECLQLKWEREQFHWVQDVREKLKKCVKEGRKTGREKENTQISRKKLQNN